MGKKKRPCHKRGLQCIMLFRGHSYSTGGFGSNSWSIGKTITVSVVFWSFFGEKTHHTHNQGVQQEGRHQTWHEHMGCCSWAGDLQRFSAIFSMIDKRKFVLLVQHLQWKVSMLSSAAETRTYGMVEITGSTDADPEIQFFSPLWTLTSTGADPQSSELFTVIHVDPEYQAKQHSAH